jgi:hypothetical protein
MTIISQYVFPLLLPFIDIVEHFSSSRRIIHQQKTKYREENKAQINHAANQ